MSENIVIKKINENEIHLNENKIIFLEGNLIFVCAVGKVTESLAKEGEKIIVDFLNTTKTKTNIIVDLTNAGQPSTKAIKIYSRVADMDLVKNVAMYGQHPVAMVLGSMMIRLSKKNNFRFFKTKEEALHWFKEKNND